jgi:hypothetical protein
MTLNNVENCPNGARPLCSKCKTPLGGVRKDKKAFPSKMGYTLSALLLIGSAFFTLLMFQAPTKYHVDFSDVEANELAKTEAEKNKYDDQFRQLELSLQAEVDNISEKTLRIAASNHYDAILEGRRSYDKQYALTLREKAQLRMAELASESTTTYRDSIASVAKEAAPQGADVDVILDPYTDNFALHIDFDMSSMTSGEHGTRTKHHTKESLKNEVETLISRVTTDVYVFCKDLNINTIHVGCRHMVRTTYPNGRTADENTMLYKIKVPRNQVKSLSSNPFLHSYSTRKYWNVDEDNFNDIYISTTRL